MICIPTHTSPEELPQLPIHKFGEIPNDNFESVVRQDKIMEETRNANGFPWFPSSSKERKEISVMNGKNNDDPHWQSKYSAAGFYEAITGKDK